MDSIPNDDLMKRVCQLTNRIYQEILCKGRNERMAYITFRGLRVDYVPVGDFSSTPQHWIILSGDLLDWIMTEGRIPRFFTNFITTPELSGTLYISPDIYHTQITEYLLDNFFR